MSHAKTKTKEQKSMIHSQRKKKKNSQQKLTGAQKLELTET